MGGLERTWCLRPAQSSTLHVLYINICSRDTSYHLYCISVVCFCVGPPWSALAMPGSPCLYLCHRNNPEECLWQVYHRCCLLLPDRGCLHGCMSRQANTSNASWQQTLFFYGSSNKQAVLMHWGRDLCDMLRGPPVCFFFFFFTVSGQLCMYIISPACCAFSLCYPCQGEFWEEESWQSEALLLSLHSSLSLSLSLSRWDQMEGSEEG